MKLQITLDNQQLTLFDGKKIIMQCTISSAKAGIGQQQNSFKTPLGRHSLCEKIGDGMPINAVFVGRQWTGEIYTPELGQKEKQRDWILTRILRLKGLQPGFNQGGNVDTFERMIYIHGIKQDDKVGEPASHGCIRLKNDDMLRLYDMVNVGDEVIIER